MAPSSSPSSSSSDALEIYAPPSPPRVPAAGPSQALTRLSSSPPLALISTSQSYGLPSTPPALRNFKKSRKGESLDGVRPSEGARERSPPGGGGKAKERVEVMEIGSSEDELSQTQVEMSDDGLTVLSFRPSTSALPAPSSDADDLPPANELHMDSTTLRAEARKLKKTQSAPPLAAPSAATTAARPAIGERSASAVDKGKARLGLEYLQEEGEDETEKAAGKKRKERSAGEDGAGGVAPKPKKKGSASAPVLDQLGKQVPAAAVPISKAAAKASASALAKEHRSANLVQRNRKETVTELTCHVAGLGLFPTSADEDDLEGETMFSLPLKRGAKPKPSIWLEVLKEFEERMSLYTLPIERAAEKSADDLRSEGSVQWTRLCDRKWNEERGLFVPLGKGNEILVEEDSRLIFMTALELSSLIARGTLHAHIERIKERLAPRINLFLMIHGLGSLFTKLRNAEGREYHARVLNKELPPSSIGIGEGQPDKDTIELALVRLETVTRLFVIRVESPSEASEWLEQLTFDVGFKPHQRQRFSHLTKIGGSGDDRLSSGRDLQDTFIKMLASVKGITEPLAKAILREYPTVRELYEAWEACGSEMEKKNMLVGIRKGNNLTGAATDRTLGKANSERIYHIFTGKDGDQFLAA